MLRSGHLFGLVLIVVGLPLIAWPSRLARWNEQWDALGSTRALSEVEPNQVKVELTRFGGVWLVATGVTIVVLS